MMLVTDDNPDLIHFLSGYFGSSYTVITASSADEAIVRLGERNIDLIVSDWMMPLGNVQINWASRSAISK